MRPQIKKMLAPIRRRVSNLIARAVITLVDDSLKLQGLQIKVLADETLDNVERFQQYGYTSVPLPGAEAILLCLGGHRDHPVVITVDDRRFRLKALTAGEVSLYDDQDQKIHLKRDGIHIQTALKVTVEAGATVEVMGATGAPVKGVVQGDCLCAYTGAPHPMISDNVKGSV